MSSKPRLILPLVISMFAVAGMAAQAFAQVKAGDTLKTKEVVFGAFKHYVHPQKTFSMDIPENWSIDDASTAAETILKLADPTTNAAVVVHVWRQEGELPGGSTQFLKEFLRTTVSTLPNFSEGDPKVQKDGSVGIYFKYDQTVSNGTFDMWGDAFIQRDGELVGMMFFIIPKEQYDLKQQSAYRLINSFKIEPQAGK